MHFGFYQPSKLVGWVNFSPFDVFDLGIIIRVELTLHSISLIAGKRRVLLGEHHIVLAVVDGDQIKYAYRVLQHILFEIINQEHIPQQIANSHPHYLILGQDRLIRDHLGDQQYPLHIIVIHILQITVGLRINIDYAAVLHP